MEERDYGVLSTFDISNFNNADIGHSFCVDFLQIL